MDSIVAFINDVGTTCKASISTVLTINYVVAETFVALLKRVCQALVGLILGFGNLLQIVIEDFGVFLEEVSETVLLLLGGIVTSVDGLINAVSQLVLGFCSTVYQTLQLLQNSILASVKVIYDASDLLGAFLYLSASSLILAIRLIPQMVTSGLWGIYRGFRSLVLFVGETSRQSFYAVAAAPLQAVLGFVTAAVFLYLSYRTAKRLIVERQVTTRRLASWSFQGVCFLYVVFINLNLMLLRSVIQSVEFTLGHLHVARFHGGPVDSDEEEADADPEVIPAEHLDESDVEGNERAETRRRNYNLLVKRRDERQLRQGRSRSKKANTPGPADNVEDLLLEQVEREREDKLCVICQDREKCIMILPCRHLCICQDCQLRLMQRTDQPHSRTCPICRKNVKQTIKAYL